MNAAVIQVCNDGNTLLCPQSPRDISNTSPYSIMLPVNGLKANNLIDSIANLKKFYS